jgi:hypothetical protein
VPTDYDEIRAENVARYGWDAAVLELLGQLYSDRTHFIFELIQNAEDAGATELTFELFADRLEVRHDGRPFTTADVRGVCGVSQGTKANDLTQIGKFGIGFKSVYAYTATPLISSGEENFYIRQFVRPHAAAPPTLPAPPATPTLSPPSAPPAPSGQSTSFVFPFDRPEVPALVAYDEISAALSSLSPEILLFLRHIKRIKTAESGQANVLLERTATPRGRSGRHVILASQRNDRRSNEEWFVWSRPLAALGEPELAVEIAFVLRAEIDARHLARRETAPLVVFFPTEKETFLGFSIQGPYRTTPARDNVPEHDPWNQALARETAQLLDEVLAELRDQDLLTVDILQALPLDPAHFHSGSMLRPLFDTVRQAIRQQRLIPDDAGGYRTAAEVRLGGGAGLRELLTPGQLGVLCGVSWPVAFAAESVTEETTPLLWRYLRDEIGVGQVTPETVVEALTSEFLADQPDRWIAGCYRFLLSHRSLWEEPRQPGDQPGPARAKPIIRLTDGTQVLPFTAGGRPAAYLPGPVATQFPTVRRAVADDPDARRFLEALGFAEPDVLAEVIDHVLPRYDQADAGALNAAGHEADLELVARALAEASPAGRARLLEQLHQTTFLVGENAASGKNRLMRPGDLYQRTPALELYFAGNPDAWFAADSYGPWRAQLRGMGVHETVRLCARTADELGHVLIADEFARHERGIAGFDPDASLDGLDYALAHPSAARSEFVWNKLLLANRHLIAGVVEQSPRLGFVDARRTPGRSQIGELATAAAWLPAPDGTFLRPADIDLADLPPTFARDDGLAQALGLTQAVIEEANRQLGFPPDFLRRLAAQPDLVEMIEGELRNRA